MTFKPTQIAAGASLLGIGGVAGVLLAPQNAESQNAAAVRMQAAPPPVVRTIHVRRVHHRTIHEKPHVVHHVTRAAASAPAAVAAAPAPAQAAAPVRQVSAAPAPHPLRTRTSGSSGSGSDDGGHEHGDSHEAGDD
jgi:hypothetical protein